MKKNLFILMLAALLLLSACEASDPENLFGTSVPSESVQETAPLTVGLLGEAGEAYAYSAMQGSRWFAYDGTQILFVAFRRDAPNTGNVLLYSFDVQTGEISLFCQDATCLHDDVDCPSYDMTAELEYYQGRLYGVSSIDLYLKVLKNGAFEQVLNDSGIRTFFHADNNLYVATQDNSLLCCPDNSGEWQVILDDYLGNTGIVYHNILYYSHGSRDLYRFDLSLENAMPELLFPDVQHLIDGKHIYYAPDDTRYLYRSNLDGSDSQLLLEEPTLLSRAAFDGNYFYYVLHTDFTDDPHPSGEKAIDIWRFPKSDPSQKELLVTLPCTDCYIEIIPGYERIFLDCTTRGAEGGYGTPSLYTMKPDGTDLREHTLPEI